MDLFTLMSFLGWGAFVGIVFSAIGAAGGILTSFGLITLFGVMDPNSVKPMTQLVVLAAALVFVPGYLRLSCLVWPLGLLLGAGGLIGAYIGSTLSSLYLSDMQTFRPVFGILTLGIAAQIIWKLTRPMRNGGSTDAPAEQVVGCSVMQTTVTRKTLSFSYGTLNFSVPVWSPLVAGLLIAMTASIFGVGGGFLLVPYMAIFLGMPMHIIPGTAAIAIFMSLIVSISNFLALGAPIDLSMLVPLAIGAVVGSIVGPRVNKALKNQWLQVSLAIIVTGIGLNYVIL
jgi:uncharacterized protein